MVLSIVMRSREFKALLKQSGRSLDVRATHLRLLSKLDTAFCGPVGRFVVWRELTTRALAGQNRIFFLPVRTSLCHV